METKYKQIEFDIELAKKIQAGEVPGEIVTRSGRKARIVCYDANRKRSIVSLVTDNKGNEQAFSYPSNGRYTNQGMPSGRDLLLRIPDASPQLEFKPFDKVLWRDEDEDVWQCGLFSHYTESVEYPYALTYGWRAQCIPFNEDTEHLLGTKEGWKK